MADTQTQINNFNIDEMIDSVKRLTTILQEENILLNNMQFKEVAEFHQEKKELTLKLEKMKKWLSKTQGAQTSIPKDKVVILNFVNSKFKDVMAENFQSLTRAKAVNQKLVDILKSATMSEMKEKANYDKDGNYSHPNKKTNEVPPLTVNSNV
jgi:flagellar biosynthesis/type III secretory pathway chaperone